MPPVPTGKPTWGMTGGEEVEEAQRQSIYPRNSEYREAAKDRVRSVWSCGRRTMPARATHERLRTGPSRSRGSVDGAYDERCRPTGGSADAGLASGKRRIEPGVDR
jgi:hypothetical protein